ncbi:hypothetical protein [Sporomusa carbonis]|uniref:hypothetical protein n=1 Tax=Sporomusa carbonis TaxID=3076075 RepID=UPI003C7C21D5
MPGQKLLSLYRFPLYEYVRHTACGLHCQLDGLKDCRTLANNIVEPEGSLCAA